MCDALKSCPFCGGPAEIIHVDEGENAGGSCVSCTRCLASSNIDFGRKENFISNWNRRPPDPEVERLREALSTLVANKDAFDASSRNQADAYYCLVKGRDADWAAARAVLAQAAELVAFLGKPGVARPAKVA